MPARASSSRSCAPPPAAAAARCRPRTWPRSTPSPSSRSTWGWPTSTARSSTPCPRRWPRRRAREPGQGPVRRAGRRRLRRSSAGPRPSTRAGWRRCGGWSAPRPVLTPALLALCRAVAERYAGTLGDVLRLAVPPRHADRGEEPRGRPAEPPRCPTPGPWAHYPAGPSFLRRIAAGEAPAASWLALPGAAGAVRWPPRTRARCRGRRRRCRRCDWPAGAAARRRLAGRARGGGRHALAAGRGALIVVPDHRDVDRVDAALTAVLGHRPARPADRRPGAAGPLHGLAEGAARPRALRRRHPRRDVRARSTTWAWSPGGTTATTCSTEPRAPYPHVREVLALRARTEGAALLTGGFTRSDRGPAAGSRRASVQPGRGRAGRRAPRRPPGARGRRGHRRRARRPGRDGPPAVGGLAHRQGGARARARCWSRCRAAATCPRCPARPAASPRAARAARGRWR